MTFQIFISQLKAIYTYSFALLKCHESLTLLIHAPLMALAITLVGGTEYGLADRLMIGIAALSSAFQDNRFFGKEAPTALRILVSNVYKNRVSIS